jgi:hypothetical protein
VLAVVSWAAVSGNWGDPNNWSTGAVPGPDDTALIDAAGSPYTILLNGNQTVGELGLTSGDAELWIQGGFVILAAASVTGTFAAVNVVNSTRTTSSRFRTTPAT